MRIGIFGVPIEIAISKDHTYFPQLFVPHITDNLRHQVIHSCKQLGLSLEDLNEISVGDEPSNDYCIEPFIKLDDDLVGKIVYLDRLKLELERRRILALSKEFDLIIGIGPSHLGAITLYEKRDRVARYDYHGDFAMGYLEQDAYLTHANYMIWVKNNIRSLKVGNYFLGSGEYHGTFLEANDFFGETCNYHDIDPDCFGDWIQSSYNVTSPIKFGSTGLKLQQTPITGNPKRVYENIRKSHPNKLGFWEYRADRDPSKKGVDFITCCIANAVGIQTNDVLM